LGRAGLVDSQRGATGGYALSRAADSIRLGEIIAAIEGAPSLTGCETLGAYEAGGCDVSPVCPIKNPMQRIRFGIWELLQRTTLRDLASPPGLHALELGPMADQNRADGLGQA
ncbi:MAG: Rrf2 family transcriptional regulator, partial [Planctomycetota bacterium]